jgi:hypothetical protein
MSDLLIVYHRGNAVVLDTGDRYRDTLVVTVRGDGVDIPPFFVKGEYVNASIACGRRPRVGQSPSKGMTVARMTNYIDHLSEYVSKSSLVIMDRLSSHTSKKVLRYFESKRTADGRQKFIPFLLNPKTAFLISPLDNSAIGDFKRKFYKYDRSTLKLKEAAAYHAWNQVSNRALRGYIADCGIVGNEDTSSILLRFMKKVKGGIPEKNLDVWAFYEGWRSGAYLVEGVPPPRASPLLLPEQLSNDELDGSYWRTYGSMNIH